MPLGKPPKASLSVTSEADLEGYGKLLKAVINVKFVATYVFFFLSYIHSYPLTVSI